MKKILSTVILFMAVVLLVSCSGIGKDSGGGKPSAKPGNDSSGDSTVLFTEPIYSYESYEDLSKAISPGSKLIAGAETFLVPCSNGERMNLREKEGVSKITLYTEDTFSRPWFLFYCESGDTAVRIRTMYLKEDEIAYAEGKSCSDFLKKLDPKFVNVENAAAYKNYTSVKTEDARLADRTVSAMICKGAISETTYYFVYDNVLVTVSAPHSFFDKGTEFFSALSFEEFSR